MNENDRALAQQLIITEFFKATERIDEPETAQEVNDLLNALQLPRTAPLATMAIGFLLGYGKGIELATKLNKGGTADA